MPKLYKKLIDIIALLCLAAVFLFYIFLFKKLVDGRNRREEAEQNIWKEKRNRNLVYAKE